MPPTSPHPTDPPPTTTDASSSSTSAEAAAPPAPPARPKRRPNAKQKEYIVQFLKDLETFSKYPRGVWPRLETTVGQNDGTWKAICAHFIRNPGTPDREILLKTWVTLESQIIKQCSITEGAFLVYTSRSYNGTRLPWRANVSDDMSHIESKTDSRTHAIKIRLLIEIRKRKSPFKKKKVALLK
ncbi:hypothetical protein HDU86_008071 [Geranomyces michiganensis]|nr:hypothetical protein HDU86_008071 [Geranomyces michiganensis]